MASRPAMGITQVIGWSSINPPNVTACSRRRDWRRWRARQAETVSHTEIAGVGTESVPASEARRFSHGLKLRVNLSLACAGLASSREPGWQPTVRTELRVGLAHQAEQPDATWSRRWSR